MATRNSTVKARSRRRRTLGAESHRKPAVERLERAIETERSRLWQACAVLECLGLALTYADDEERNRSDFSDAAAVANQLVGETIERLDSVYIGPLIQRIIARSGTSSIRSRRNT